MRFARLSHPMSWRTWAVCGALYVMFVAFYTAAAAPPGPSPSSITLLELFTSEGCSSCPPADALLLELEKRKAGADERDLLVLAYHVDYWNSLGWRDRWSDAAFSERQRAYAARLGSNRVYTPQLVVNGRVEFVGSDRGRVEREIEKSSGVAPLPITFTASEGTIDVRFGTNLAAGDLYLALAERGLSSKVERGENAGKLLRHPSVVRMLHRTTAEERAAGSARLELPRDLDRAAARVVAFVQEPDEGVILAAGWAPLDTAP